MAALEEHKLCGKLCGAPLAPAADAAFSCADERDTDAGCFWLGRTGGGALTDGSESAGASSKGMNDISVSVTLRIATYLWGSEDTKEGWNTVSSSAGHMDSCVSAGSELEQWHS